MSFDPSLSTPRDRVRLQVGDTSGDPATEFMPDETYNAVLAYNGNDETKALIAMAEALIAKFSSAASRINLGDLEVSWRDRLKSWTDTIKKFSGVREVQAGGGFQMVRPRRNSSHAGEYSRNDGQNETWFNEPWDRQ